MALQLLYFASVREGLGRDGEVIALPPSVVTMTDLVAFLAARDAGSAAALSDMARLRFAVDQRIAGPDAVIGDAREVAIFPPVTGG